MTRDDLLGAGDPGALEALYQAYERDRHAVAADMAGFFSAEIDADRAPHALLATAFRTRGYLAADLDPLGLRRPPAVPELDPRAYGLGEAEAAPLRAVWCSAIGWEIEHLHDHRQRAWLTERAEAPMRDLDRAVALDLLSRAQAFEAVLAARLPTTKRFGSEGAEGFLLLMETVLQRAVMAAGVTDVTIGGMHRGRLAQLALIAGKPLPELIAEVNGNSPLPPGFDAASDVPYHLGYSGDREVNGRTIHISVAGHPSHLEVVSAVALGRARAKRSRGVACLPMMVHTDASFAGQGIVAELFQMARLPAFDVGGTIHLVLNNQLGFTTTPDEGYSARFCTDIAHLTEVPVLHVNGDDAEALVRAGQVAADWRATFGRDIVIDVWAYRRNGHNEIDEPRFTHPVMYRAIDRQPPVAERAAARWGLTPPDQSAFRARVEAAFETTRRPNRVDWFTGAWAGLKAGDEADMTAFVATGLPLDTLRRLGHDLTRVPEGFRLDDKLTRFLKQRRATLDQGTSITWATAEALAFASLTAEDRRVRLIGQDTPRGAFTQRHLLLHDQITGAVHSVLGEGAEVVNSPLIEYGVLGFEYGHATGDPHTLVVWEAQFGDFLNIAQAVFDQFIVCGEDRWQRSSGLVLLLPHGLDGGGPDHSTARPERLLAACAGANLQVANPSTPANFFHLLRRQMLRPFRKPLAVLAPKALLRLRRAVSSLDDMEPGTGFRCVLPDPTVSRALRVVLCSGKVYYDLMAEREARGCHDIALVRLEQLWPLPAADLRAALEPYPDAELVWCQEEPANMGPFLVLDRPLERLLGRPLRYAGRPPAASPAAGFKDRHEAERAAVLDAALS